MSGVSPGFGALPAVSTVEARIALTVAAFALFVVVGWVASLVIRRVRDRRFARVIDVAVVGVVLAVVLLVGAYVVYLWNAGPLVQQVARAVKNPVSIGVEVAATLLTVAVAYVSTGLLHRLVDRIVESRDRVSRHQAEVVYRLVQVTTYGLAGVVVLGVWSVNLGGLLVGAGFLGIVLGMASRQTLGALLAGFVIMFSRPFEIGDWVQVGDKEGIVTDITIVNTRIQTFDGEYVMVPNDIVSANEIINRTRKGRLRIHVEVGVDYDTDLEEAVDVATAAMRDVEDILSVPQPQVVLTEFGASSVVLGLRFWIDKPSARRKWRAQTAVIAAVKRAFDEHGIKIPFPQREVAGRTEEGGFRVRGDQPAVPIDTDGQRGDDD